MQRYYQADGSDSHHISVAATATSATTTTTATARAAYAAGTIVVVTWFAIEGVVEAVADVEGGVNRKDQRQSGRFIEID